MDREETLGRRIRRIRKQRGMTLDEVGRGEFTRAWVSQIELGVALPSTRVLRVIAERLGTPVEYLLDGREGTIERELALEKARVLIARGEPSRALLALRPALGSLEWPFGSDARLTQAEALMALGRRETAAGILEAERKAIAEHGDTHRLERARAIARGEPFRYSSDAVKTHLRLADRAQRAAKSRDALEHYRAARVLLEAGVASG